MSIVAVQLGQCGNQVGHEVFNTICGDVRGTHGLCSKKENEAYHDACTERFFSEAESGVPVARAVLVDMEPKVISQTLSIAARSGHWKYDDQSHFCQKQGSGNNWANGYSVHGPRNKEVIMNLVQKEVEKCDRLSGFFTIMSMAGGTGSGLGAFVTQCLRDAFPTSFILNHVIWPYGTGDLMEALVPHPEFKMLGLRNIPQMPENSLAYSTFSWPGLLKHLRQMLIANAKMEEGIDWQVRPPCPGSSISSSHSTNKLLHFNTSIANLVILRGKDMHSVDLGSFRDPSLYTSWLNPQDAFNAWKTPRAFNKYEKSASLVSNSQFLLKPLDNVVGKAWNMFASKAYIHQYTKFGIEEEDFLDSFTTLEQVISSYTNL
ncbi:tubulin delta chain isoform X4 [Gallus gallus]|uniref:Tubulin delta chain n=1 Tax=Gallus gallus TaxID=9031 RepID=A0A8V1AMY0_CHICK|nr:tubulin delta chain isoform X4 [Gallus gallus]XP_040543373.1 tubulin delta chain isoform X4 [Gallus gallus]XP_046758633.1 tubulin delta chain isoform X4 [Gallus gallus]XP_046758634.1 tubulin delta chain isoform X4 [Gallus gallus]XP_046758635.1 tubulin delta chain isoform X4 [Gallus gallus]XP_046758636.1 tubulin delta chain isoform X4 [Gallus gallus]XP_046758637.1 tubulin delta chain isoform X4 [Gallus gallus]XP_046786309.1 tubulin delta chain isoform X4 [Gallus gallus]XP_046786311.1 tubu